MENLKLVKTNYRGKKLEKLVIKGAVEGKITAYVKHKPTGAAIPISSDYIKKMQSGETFPLYEAERQFNRRYFKISQLEIRWDMEPADILKKIIDYEVPCFVNSNEVHTENGLLVGCSDVCLFEEYAIGIEKKEKIKIKDVKSKYRGFNKH